MVNDIWLSPVLLRHLQTLLLSVELLLPIAAHGYTATTGATAPVSTKHLQL